MSKITIKSELGGEPHRIEVLITNEGNYIIERTILSKREWYGWGHIKRVFSGKKYIKQTVFLTRKEMAAVLGGLVGLMA